MQIPLKITTDYSLLKSTICIDDLIAFLKKKDIPTCALVDENLYGVMEFYNKCLKNNIKPIIGLEINLNKNHFYLYAKNYKGYQNLLKLHSIMTVREISFVDLEIYQKNIIVVVPFASLSLYQEINKIFEIAYIGYQSEYEKTHAILKSENIVYVQNIRSLTSADTICLDYLEMINQDCKVSDYTMQNYENNYFHENVSLEDVETTKSFAEQIELVIPKNENYIPEYNTEIKDSYAYLENLTQKGLEKRLKGNVEEKYRERLKYELGVIKNMGFVDYILIVYDYVLYAKKNHVFVGPGRGSAAGSLVCYTLGITDIDPLKYNLLFERFLNPERVTMPDIDIDFENTKRSEVIAYIRNRYGENKVASIMTFATLKSKLVLREMARVFSYTEKDFDALIKEISSTKNLRENLENPKIKQIVEKNKTLQKMYKISLRLEGLKKNISTHAAGVVISKVALDEIIPIIKIGDSISTGITMEYLEELGLLKMDLLAIKNLTIISSILELIEKDTGKRVDLNKIDLNDKSVLDLFAKADTTGIFQFESSGMRSFLSKLRSRNFNDIVASIALYRPGPMDNINTFIKRKDGYENVTYLLPELKPILEETEGIIVYQEQVMQILVKIGSYSYAEADIIRRAMSKKKREVIEKEKEKFVSRAIENGYEKKVSEELYELILKFAGYGFNKSHSVSYALIGYQMAYLKVKFPTYFITNLLNMSIGAEVKTKEYLSEAKAHNLEIVHPSINESEELYKIESNKLILPLSIIKGLSSISIESILEERKKGAFLDFVDFVKRTIHKNVNERILEILIHAGVMDAFGNMTTLKENLPTVLNYAELASDVDSPLLLKPILKEYEEQELQNKLELESYGFYITNHPASIYQSDAIMKLKNIENFFDKYVRCVVLIESIRKTKTKTGEEMAFIEASDETGISSFVVFARQIRLIDDLKPKQIAEIQGRVTKRYDKYQINVNNIIKK